MPPRFNFNRVAAAICLYESDSKSGDRPTIDTKSIERFGTDIESVDFALD